MVVSNMPRSLTPCSEFVFIPTVLTSKRKRAWRRCIMCTKNFRVSLPPFDSKYSGYHCRYEDLANIVDKPTAALFTFSIYRSVWKHTEMNYVTNESRLQGCCFIISLALPVKYFMEVGQSDKKL